MVLLKSVRAIFIYIIAFVICVIFPLQAQAIPPNTSITLDPARPNIIDGWYSTTPTITLTSNDSSSTTRYKWDVIPDSSTQEGTIYTGPFPALEGYHPRPLDYPGPEIDHTLYYYSQNSTDTENIKFAKIKVDTDSAHYPPEGTRLTHGNFFDDTDLCVNCHRSHTGVAPGLLKGTGSTANAAMQLCYFCHDGTGSKYNIKSQMGETPGEKASQHPVPQNLIACTNCHDPHLRPDTNPRLFGSTITDPNGADKGPVTGNDNSVCKACHPDPISSPVFGGLPIFDQTKHGSVSSSGLALTRWPDASFGPGMCGNCHNPHGSDDTNLRRGWDSTAADNTNKLCYGCHDDDKAPSKPVDYFYRGKTAFGTSAHSGFLLPSEKLAKIVWPNADDTGKVLPTGGTQPGAVAGECINCHNPHGKDDGSGNPFPKLTMAKEEGLCFSPEPTGCHSAVTGSVNGIDIEERFSYYPLVKSNLIPPQVYTGNDTGHHDVTDADQLASGGKVECNNCHNPHLNGRSEPDKVGNEVVVNPDNPSALFSDTTPDPFGYSSVVIRGSAVTEDTKLRKDNDELQENYPNYPNSPRFLWVGKDKSVNEFGTALPSYLWRTLIKFKLASIPPGVTIDKATLLFYWTGDVNAKRGDFDIDIHRVTEEWVENQATWVRRNSSTNWTTAGGSIDPSSASTKTSVASYITFFGTENFDVTDLVKAWYSDSYPNYGMLIKRSDENNADVGRGYPQSEDAAPPNLPSLVIRYKTTEPPFVNDTVGFCSKCHDEAAPAGVTFPLGMKTISTAYLNHPLYGDLYGEMHGAKASRGDAKGLSSLHPSYYVGMPALPCTECHDPHGSKNVYHLKENVNGQTVTLTTIDVTNTSNNNADARAIQSFCQGCHNLQTGHHGTTETRNCFSCHSHQGGLPPGFGWRIF